MSDTRTGHASTGTGPGHYRYRARPLEVQGRPLEVQGQATRGTRQATRGTRQSQYPVPGTHHVQYQVPPLPSTQVPTMPRYHPVPHSVLLYVVPEVPVMCQIGSF